MPITETETPTGVSSPLELQFHARWHSASLDRCRKVGGGLVVPQHNLGDRDTYMIRAAKEINVKELAAQAGYSNVSRYGADMFASIADRLDLLVGPRTAWRTLPSLDGFDGPPQVQRGECERYMVRVAAEVNTKGLATAAGYSNVSRYGADLFAIAAGRPDLVLGADLIQEEDMLPISA
ncbi:hypothetical protein [uncultured Williamsia sp.]|uniref:hypothetical protein n=1 Tax=uncultured Williamsia sp. TaxID=259311 RepID=UPI002631370A|nr:hypothetical protein [uncultured Williamsia sp.]